MSGAVLDSEDIGLNKYIKSPPANHINKHTKSASIIVDVTEHRWSTLEVGEGMWEKIREGFLEEGPGAEARRIRN